MKSDLKLLTVNNTELMTKKQQINNLLKEIQNDLEELTINQTEFNYLNISLKLRSIYLITNSVKKDDEDLKNFITQRDKVAVNNYKKITQNKYTICSKCDRVILCNGLKQHQNKYICQQIYNAKQLVLNNATLDISNEVVRQMKLTALDLKIKEQPNYDTLITQEIVR